MLKDYLIGSVHPDDIEKLGSSTAKKTESSSSDNPTWITAIVGIVAVVAALYLKFGQAE